MTEMSVESAAKVDVKQMSKTERTELRRIIKRRFRMLKEQLRRREHELTLAIEQQLKEERETSVAKIEAKLKPLFERQNKLAAAYAAVYAEAAELGVMIRLQTTQPIDPARERSMYGRSVGVLPDVHSDAQQRILQIKEEAGWGKLNLNEMEWRLDEQLAVGEIESTSASDFLAALPTVESLLPLPAGVAMPELKPGEIEI